MVAVSLLWNTNMAATHVHMFHTNVTNETRQSSLSRLFLVPQNSSLFPGLNGIKWAKVFTDQSTEKVNSLPAGFNRYPTFFLKERGSCLLLVVSAYTKEKSSKNKLKHQKKKSRFGVTGYAVTPSRVTRSTIKRPLGATSLRLENSYSLLFVSGPVHTKPEKFENATIASH